MNMIPERSPPTITTIAMFNLSCTVYNFFLGAFIKRTRESQEEVPWLSSHDILRFRTVTHVPVFRSVSCRVLLKSCHSVQWSQFRIIPEVVSISKWWKSNLKSSCSKTAFLSQSQPVSLQTIFHESLVRICRIQSWMYFCCQWEDCLHWPQDCMISLICDPTGPEGNGGYFAAKIQ